MKYIKKIALIVILFVSTIATHAQTKKAIKLTNKEKATQAKFIKIEKQKKLLRDSSIIKLNIQDSTRLAFDSIADVQKNSARMAYRDSGLRVVDSITNMQTKAMAYETNLNFSSDNSNQAMAQSSKLNDYQEKQIVIINTKYSEKAKALTINSDLQSKAAELSALNQQRKAEITALVGKRKAKIVEQNRKNYTKKTGAVADLVWIDVAEQNK